MKKGAAFVVGWLVSLATVVTVTVLVSGNNPPKPGTVPSGAALAVRIAVGVILVAVAIRQRWRMRRPDKPKKAPKWQEHVDSMSPWFALGLAPVVQPWALIAAGAATVTAARLLGPGSYLVLALFCILASASYLGIEGYAGLRPGTSQAFLARFRTWMETHTDQLIIWGGLILGSGSSGRAST